MGADMTSSRPTRFICVICVICGAVCPCLLIAVERPRDRTCIRGAAAVLAIRTGSSTIPVERGSANPKYESRNPKQIRNSKVQNVTVASSQPASGWETSGSPCDRVRRLVRHRAGVSPTTISDNAARTVLDFGFRICFGIRIWCFGFRRPAAGSTPLETSRNRNSSQE